MAASDLFYYELQEEVNLVLAEYGKLYRVTGGGVYNEQTMMKEGQSVRDVQGIVADQSFANQLAPTGWTAVSTLIMSAEANPKAGESVEVDGKLYPLSACQTIKPADVVVCYMLDVSR